MKTLIIEEIKEILSNCEDNEMYTDEELKGVYDFVGVLEIELMK